MSLKVESGGIGFLLRSAAVAGASGLAGLITIFAIAELNLAIGAQSIWFPLPALCIAGAMLCLVDVGQRSRSPHWYASGVWLRVGILAAFVTMLGVGLSGFERVLDGSIALRGDSKAASQGFRIAFSVVVGIASAMVEEASVRGLFQLRAQKVVGETYAQVWAGAIFLALHGTAVFEPRRLLFLTAVAACSGYLASLTRTATVPAIFHALVNTAITITVLALRP